MRENEGTEKWKSISHITSQKCSVRPSPTPESCMWLPLGCKNSFSAQTRDSSFPAQLPQTRPTIWDDDGWWIWRYLHTYLGKYNYYFGVITDIIIITAWFNYIWSSLWPWRCLQRCAFWAFQLLHYPTWLQKISCELQKTSTSSFPRMDPKAKNTQPGFFLRTSHLGTRVLHEGMYLKLN